MCSRDEDGGEPDSFYLQEPVSKKGFFGTLRKKIFKSSADLRSPYGGSSSTLHSVTFPGACDSHDKLSVSDSHEKIENSGRRASSKSLLNLPKSDKYTRDVYGTFDRRGKKKAKTVTLGSAGSSKADISILTQDRRISTTWYSDVYVPIDSVEEVLSKLALKDELAEVSSGIQSLDNGDESKNQVRAKQLSIGRKKFNMDPKKGIEFLVEQGLLVHTPEDVASFLYGGEGLNKTAIGDYLGEKHDFNEAVLKAFVHLHDFTDLILVQALRQFLWSFRLPGEAQKIDRMMETFAQRYCQLNPNIFTSTDTCYVLSFAVIMLNTSLHNPSVKDKPSIEQFISMNRGINDGKDLPRDILESIYESVKAEPFKIPEDDGNDLMLTFFNPDREGWLWKQGGRYKSWKRRWFILNDNCLYYFEYTTDKEPRGIIPLENIRVREVVDRSKPHCFEIHGDSGVIKACKTDSDGKVVEGKHTVYRMSAASADEKDQWMKCITQRISHHPFYDILAERKNRIQKSTHRART